MGLELPQHTLYGEASTSLPLSGKLTLGVIQSNLSYPGALGLGGARNSDLSSDLSVSQNTM